MDLVKLSLWWDTLNKKLTEENKVENVHEDINFSACALLDNLFTKVLERIQELLNFDEFKENQVLLGMATLIDHITVKIIYVGFKN